MKNTVTLVGFVGNDPEVRETRSDATITNISLATTRSYKDSEGERQQETEWHRITCFNGLGQTVADHCEKGMKVLVQGRIHYTKWTDAAGIDRYGCEIIAEKIDFLSRPKATEGENPDLVDTDDEIPF